MINLNTVLNERISRIARKEIRSQTGTTRKATVRYRSDIATLKREVAGLRKSVAFLEAQEKKRVAEQPPFPAMVDDIRFRADGLKSRRAKLGLSAGAYGKLVGVTGQTIYDWEVGRSRPRKEQVMKLVAVRGIGKREAMTRLEMSSGAKKAKPHKRGTYKQTAEQLILSLVKSRRALTSAQINEAWKKAGRPGVCDYVLSKMVKTRKLKWAKAKEGRGGRYSAT